MTPPSSTMRNVSVMQGRGVVLTTTSAKRLDEAVGKADHASEVAGTLLDRALMHRIQAATRIERAASARRAARRRCSPW